MIPKINNFTYRSFSNYNGPDDDFRKKNIIFGYNGSGKSSLVKGIEDAFSSVSGNKKENIRIYSSDYINRYLLLDPLNRRNIKGIKATFGEKNVEIENNIKDLEKNIINESEIEKLTIENIKLENEIKSEITKIFGAKKGNLRIQGKATAFSIGDTIRAYEEDLGKALKVETDKSNIEKIIGDDSIERRITALELLSDVPDIPIESIDFPQLSKNQEQEYDDIKIPNSTIIKWLLEGLTIHSEKTHCEFCGSQLDYSSIKHKVEAYTVNVKFAAEKFYLDTYKYLAEKLNAIRIILQKKESYISLQRQFEIMFDNLVETLNPLEEYTQILKYNSENINLIRKINIDELKNAISLISSVVVSINMLRNDTISAEKAKLDKIGTLIKGAVSIAISKSTLINGNIKKIDTNANLLLSYKQANEENLNKIKLLKESKIITADFMNLVNGILEEINLSIRLEIEGDDYYLKTTLLNRDELTVDDISEGEKNLLSLIFFYFEMFDDDKQTSPKHEISLIILDDPISSMDDSNRFYVLEIVRNILDLDVDQVFVLSHVWDDYCQLTFNRHCFNQDSQFASYEIRKNKQSEVIANSSKGNPYKFMFKEIYDLSLKSTLSTDCDYFHIPNTLRKVFEEFLFFKTNKNMLAQNSHKKEIESLFKITSISDKTKLGTLLTVSNVLSHTNTKTNDDILTSAKYLMKLIKDVDKLHYDAMIQS